jgi:hypothetical protein
VLADPVEDFGKAKFLTVHRAIDERGPIPAFDLDVESVAPQKNIGAGESNALVAVGEAVVVAKRLLDASIYLNIKAL